MNKLMESRFGFAIDFSKLTVAKAEQLSETITANLGKIRNSTGFHTAERNPRYMELLTVRESLSTWLNDQRQQLTEGEVSNAEVLLAAKDMVDSIQDTIEKVGKMQNEQLPQLLDTITDQISAEQADAFKNSVGTTLQALMDNLQTAREGVPPPPLPTSDLDSEEGDGFAATDAAVGGPEELGREKR
jgi:uncharacterized protein YicC (UPF0701 family)